MSELILPGDCQEQQGLIALPYQCLLAFAFACWEISSRTYFYNQVKPSVRSGADTRLLIWIVFSLLAIMLPADSVCFLCQLCWYLANCSSPIIHAAFVFANVLFRGSGTRGHLDRHGETSWLRNDSGLLASWGKDQDIDLVKPSSFSRGSNHWGWNCLTKAIFYSLFQGSRISQVRKKKLQSVFWTNYWENCEY